MQLSQWKHPSSQVLYIYVNGFFPSECADVKAWFVENSRAGKGYSLKTKGDYSPVADSLDALEADIMAALGLGDGDGWMELKARVGVARSFGAKPVIAPSREQEALALNIASIEMLKPITIQVDHREPKALVELLEQHSMITVISDSGMQLGDIMVEDYDGNQLLIERKRCDGAGKTDFESSIQSDGRLFDQSERLKFAVANSDKQIIPVFILEGDVYQNATSMLCQQIDGAISFLAAVQRVCVFPTYNMNHSAYVIAKLASHFVDGLYTPVTLHKAKPKVLFEQQRYALESLPGISTKTAELLLETFGSVRKVLLASESELLSVPNLGKKRVADLIKVLD